MDILKTVRSWSAALAETVISLLALGIVLQILMGEAAIPFFGQPRIIETVTGHINTLGGECIVCLVAIWVLYSVWKARK